jgi:site-specific recombinase XerC
MAEAKESRNGRDHIRDALRYLRYRARNQRPRTGDAAALTRLLDLLTERGVIAPRRTPIDVTPAQRLLDEYALYLRQERVLASPTRVNYLRFVRSFLAERFGGGRLRLSVLCAADVIRFVQHEAAHLPPKVAKLVTTALRSFLRYARYRGYIAVDLAAAVPAVANWSMASIPRSIEPDHVRRVLAGCNRQSAVGRRDYAILLLLARLGLRAGEVAGLALEDIDWEVGCLNVRGKGGHRSALPLPAEGRSNRRLLASWPPRQHQPICIFARKSTYLWLPKLDSGVVGRQARSRAGRHRYAAEGCVSVPACIGVRDAAPGRFLARYWSDFAPSQPSDDSDLREGRSGLVASPRIALAGSYAMTTTLRASIQDYLAMRRGLGFKLHDAGVGLLSFVSFMDVNRRRTLAQERRAILARLACDGMRV